jgi:hypothetical protein
MKNTNFIDTMRLIETLKDIKSAGENTDYNADDVVRGVLDALKKVDKQRIENEKEPDFLNNEILKLEDEIIRLKDLRARL